MGNRPESTSSNNTFIVTQRLLSVPAHQSCRSSSNYSLYLLNEQTHKPPFSSRPTRNSKTAALFPITLPILHQIKMPSQTPTPLTTPSFGQQDISLCLTSTLNSKAQSPYTFITRDNENDYSPPAPPPPSPVNYPSESWSTACAIRR